MFYKKKTIEMLKNSTEGRQDKEYDEGNMDA